MAADKFPVINEQMQELLVTIITNKLRNCFFFLFHNYRMWR